jgi:hypothetical protein
MTWHQRGYDIGFIIPQGLKFHGSVLMPKSTALPEEWTELLRKFCNDLGYRFVLRQFIMNGRVRRGASFEYTCWVENVGVAPIYRRYPFVLRLTQGRQSHLYTSPANILGWLPGDEWLRETVEVPESFSPGTVTLHAGLIDPKTRKPKVRFAVEESDEEGWVPLGAIEVV